MKKLKAYNNYLTNIPNVVESNFKEITLNLKECIDESLFITSMLVYLSRINQSDGIIFKIYKNNKEIPLKIN